MKPLTILRTALFALLLATMLAAADKMPPTYQKGTITGWNTQHSTVTGAATGRSIPTHKDVYDLKGAEATYQFDDCGTFQTGKFEVGQAVDYRVEGKRIYVRRSDGKEYKCKMEGMQTVEGTKPDAPPAAAR
jgi:hypothetical protein